MSSPIESGAFKKLTIQAYKDSKFQEPVANGKYTATVNPDKYTKMYKVEYAVPDPIASPGTTPTYQQSPPSDLEFEFLFDSTGIFTDYEGIQNVFKKKDPKGVDEDIKKFLDIVYEYNGDTHRPNYLTISWGSLNFNCVLSEVSIEYKLFGADGKPVRAVAKAKFRDFTGVELAVAKASPKSPDLTHVRVVEEGDTLPLMTKRIYGDSKYYLEVARVNKITSFRKLKTGQRIFFPPIQKPE